MTAPPADEQRQTIAELMRSSPMKVGDNAFLVSSAWHDSWRRSVEDRSSDSDRPGPIDNSSFLDGDTEIRDDAREQSDYDIVPAAVYHKFLEWFGGGPNVPFPVVSGLDGRPVAARPFTLSLQFGRDTHPYRAHNFVKVATVIAYAADQFKLDKSKTAIYDFLDETKGTRLEEDQILQHYQLKPGQALLVEKARPGPSAPAPSRPRNLPAHLNGATGLSNLGNTCFFNSATQCLLHTRVLVRHFLNVASLRFNRSNPLGMGGRLAQAFADVCWRSWCEPGRCVTPSDLKRVVGQFAPKFSGFAQQDSHELLTFMLDGIHEDLNEVTVRRPTEAVIGDGTNDAVVAAQAWERHLARNRSILVDCMHGQCRSTIWCPNCTGKTTVVFDPYLSLALPLRPVAAASETAVTFVPWDFAAPAEIVKISVPALTSDAVAQALGAHFKRELAVVLAGRGHYGVEWHAPERKPIAFEVPIGAECLARCVVKQGSKWGSARELTGEFLVALPRGDVSAAQLREAVEAKLAPVWDRSVAAEELSREQQAILGDTERPTRAFAGRTAVFASSWRVDLTKEEAGLRATPGLARETVTVLLNPAEEVNFSVLMRNRELPGEQRAGGLTLKDCFEFHAQRETLIQGNEWFCENCQQLVLADKKVDIWSVPEVLIVHLRRFKSQGYRLEKVSDFVHYPERMNLRPFIVGPQKDQDQWYRLYAVSNHYGGIGGGHYTANALVQDPFGEPNLDAKWYSFDDSSASQSGSHSPTEAGYVLFYEKINQ